MNLKTLGIIGASVLINIGIIAGYHAWQKSPNQLIKQHYQSEVATLVSPHGLRKKIMVENTDNFVLVDLRSNQEYEMEHIKGAVNIPAYKDPDTSDYSAVDRIVGEFKALKAENPDKDIIVYCYSMSCMTGRKIGEMLSENGIYVMELGIGWNEWRYDWEAWNYPHEWDNTKVEDYIEAGNSDAQPEDFVSPCTLDDEFGC